MNKIFLLSTVFLFCLSVFPVKSQIGQWSFTSQELPQYQYTGKLPFEAVDNEGKDSRLPEDPYFFIGNYRLGLFTHVSGIFQFITAERSWSRINYEDKQPNYGSNSASLTIKGSNPKRTELVGMQSIASDPSMTKRLFGVGFARYEYKPTKDISCTRVVSVKPSAEINTGTPSFLISVTLKNTGRKSVDIAYEETMPVNYVNMNMQMKKKENRPLKYPVTTTVDEKQHIILAEISVEKNIFLELPSKEERFVYDVAPPTVFMHAKSNEKNMQPTMRSTGNTMAAVFDTSLKPGESKTFYVTIGLYDKNNFSSVSAQVDAFMQGADLKNAEGAFAQLWKAKLPDFSQEKNEALKREMLWDAHFVEATAKYNEYYKETFIPQGTVYSYHFGDNIANRDHLQAALPACYTNPDLAKGCIRYVMKHTEPDGEIKRGNTGFGYTQPTIYKESDQQIYMFDVVAEYLQITGDYDFLNEMVELYPAEEGHKVSVLTMLKKHFIYLRDEVGTGPNGLVRLLNSDWADSFLHQTSPNIVLGSAESHMNSAMVLAIIPKLSAQLQKSGRNDTAEFLEALEGYRNQDRDCLHERLGRP